MAFGISLYLNTHINLPAFWTIRTALLGLDHSGIVWLDHATDERVLGELPYKKIRITAI